MVKAQQNARNRRPTHWDNVDDSMVPLEGNQYGHPLARLQWGIRLEEVLLQEVWEMFTEQLSSSFQCASTTKNGRTKSQLGPGVVETEEALERINNTRIECQGTE